MFNFKCIIMATPIAPTPELTGQAAKDFLKDLAENRKASHEEKERVKKGAERIKKMIHFDF